MTNEQTVGGATSAEWTARLQPWLKDETAFYVRAMFEAQAAPRCTHPESAESEATFSFCTLCGEVTSE